MSFGKFLEEALEKKSVKLVVATTPGNPTGVVLPEETLTRIASMCKRSVGGKGKSVLVLPHKVAME